MLLEVGRIDHYGTNLGGISNGVPRTMKAANLVGNEGGRLLMTVGGQSGDSGYNLRPGTEENTCLAVRKK
jgi:hypothetical protein